jgi:putative membrane protein
VARAFRIDSLNPKPSDEHAFTLRYGLAVFHLTGYRRETLPAPLQAPREDKFPMALLLHWILSAIALLIVSRVVPGFYVAGLLPALIASAVIGLLNATLGFLLKVVTFPLTILTFGIFLLVVNSVMILAASAVVRGFTVRGFVPAFWGAVVLALLGVIIRAVTQKA